LSANYSAYALQSNRDGKRNFINSFDGARAIASFKIATGAMKQKAEIF
jgi:membrane-bound lytic murein transglycosylase B